MSDEPKPVQVEETKTLSTTEGGDAAEVEETKTVTTEGGEPADEEPGPEE